MELEKWEQTLHGCPWRTTKGAAPCAVKVARTVLNGEREETYRKATRLALTQLESVKLCQRGEWEDRMLVETVLSMLTLVCHLKKVMHRGWAYFQARLAFTMAAFNVLVQWHGFQPNASGFVPLSMPEFGL